MVDYKVDCNLPFNVAQSQSLQDLLEVVAGRRVKMPSRRKFDNTRKDKFIKMEASLKKLLSEQEHICVTCDVWSCRAQSYLGVTVHFLNENFERESFLLAFKQLYARQTYLYLAQILDDIFTMYGIKMEQITHIVTDGGSAFCKMFKEFGDVSDSVVHDCLDDDHGDDDDVDVATNGRGDHTTLSSEESNSVESSIIVEFMQGDDGELFQSNILDLSSQEPIEVDDYLGEGASYSGHQFKLPRQRRCYSHHCNLLPKDFDKALPSTADKAFKQMYNKLHSLWSTTSRSSMSKTICKAVLGCTLKIPCETRWNSKFDSIKKVYTIITREENHDKNEINILIKRLRTELKSTSHLQLIEKADVLVMRKYINVMEPVAYALDTLQGEFNCSQGLILPVLISMKHRIESIEETSPLDIDFKRTMLQVKFLP